MPAALPWRRALRPTGAAWVCAAPGPRASRGATARGVPCLEQEEGAVLVRTRQPSACSRGRCLVPVSATPSAVHTAVTGAAHPLVLTEGLGVFRMLSGSSPASPHHRPRQGAAPYLPEPSSPPSD